MQQQETTPSALELVTEYKEAMLRAKNALIHRRSALVQELNQIEEVLGMTKSPTPQISTKVRIDNEEVMQVLRTKGHARVGDIASALDITEMQANGKLNYMYNRGLIARVSTGLYRPYRAEELAAQSSTPTVVTEG